MKTAVFWGVPPCSLVDTDRRFIAAFCFYNQGDSREAVSTCETSVALYHSARRIISPLLSLIYSCS
jgi:hypothetical protein